jgi:tetratricopeptide (TPR) repeat protein
MKITGLSKRVLRILFFLIVYTISAQKDALVSSSIDSLLITVDEQLKNEKFKDATSIIDSLKNTKKYKKYNFDRLAIDLRYAQLLYERKEDEKAMHTLLDGVSQLENHLNSKLTWRYFILLDFIHDANKNYSKAFIYNNKALLNAFNRKDTLDILKSYLSRNAVFFSLSEPLDENDILYNNAIDSMLHINETIINFPLSLKTKKEIASAYSNLSHLEGVRENYTLSTFFIEKSIEIKKQLNDTIGMATALINYGNTFYRRKEYEKAIEIYKQSVELLQNSHLSKLLNIKEDSFQNISWAYSELDKYKLAYEYQDKATKIADSSAAMKTTRDIAAIEATYLEAQKTEIEKNKRLQTQFYFLGFAFITLVIGILGYIIYNRLQNKQHKTERKISGLKYKALNAQMSPHFINNLLLCIHDLIDSEEKDVAIKHLDKFNRLTNLVLRSTKSNLISLSKEIEMLELYMDLQLLRFNNEFEYSINTDAIMKKNIDSIQIPPLILQPLVENSIVHGFRSMKTKGKLILNFNTVNEDFLICTITDNGKETPENLSPEMYTKNGISLKNINERLQLIAQEKTDRELVVFTQIKDTSKKVIGSKTELNIPLIYT